MLFGKQTDSKNGVYLKVYKNPYNESERVIWLHAADKKQAQAVQYKLPHYGKYTELAFTNGRNTLKSIAETLCTSSHTRTHLPQRMHLSGFRTIDGEEKSV